MHHAPEIEAQFPPLLGSYKFNCDDMVYVNDKVAGYGGILRDNQGSFIFSFTASLKPCNASKMGLWGIYYDVCVAWNGGFKNTIIETDSVMALDHLSLGGSCGHPHHEQINSILQVREEKMVLQWDRVDRKSPWSEEEEKILIETHKEVGNKWAEIARRLPGRTENTIKNRWNATKRRLNVKRKQNRRSSNGTLLQKYIKEVIDAEGDENKINQSMRMINITIKVIMVLLVFVIRAQGVT